MIIQNIHIIWWHGSNPSTCRKCRESVFEMQHEHFNRQSLYRSCGPQAIQQNLIQPEDLQVPHQGCLLHIKYSKTLKEELCYVQ